jgi:hypothetical protein
MAHTPQQRGVGLEEIELINKHTELFSTNIQPNYRARLIRNCLTREGLKPNMAHESLSSRIVMFKSIVCNTNHYALKMDQSSYQRAVQILTSTTANINQSDTFNLSD